MRPPSCEEDIDFHRDSPTKLPKSNHVPFIGNTHNIARVEPLPPPINSNSKYLNDDIDMLEELKARAKAALLKEAEGQSEDILGASKEEIADRTNSKDKSEESLELLKSTISNLKNKRPHESEDERDGDIVDITKQGSNDDLEDSENTPLSAILKNSNDANKKQPPSKRLRRKSAAVEDDAVSPVDDNDVSSSTKSNKNPFDDEEDDEEEEDSKARQVQKDIACEEEM